MPTNEFGYQVGCIPARHKLAAAEPFRPLSAVPAEWGVVPPKLQYWGNNTDGVCVTTEEAADAAVHAAALGLPLPNVTDSEVLRYAREHGTLNGATLTEVMDSLQPGRQPLRAADREYYDGRYKSVNWEDRETLCAAIHAAQGMVKIAIASSCLGSAVQGRNGWVVLSATKNRGIDHCVGLCGYGSLAYLCGLCGVPVPSGADPGLFCYLMFTWSTVGIVSEQAMRNMTGEAYVRLPTKLPEPAYPVGPGPEPPPGPPEPPVPPEPEPLSPCLPYFRRLAARIERPLPEAAEAVTLAANEIRAFVARLNRLLDKFLPKGPLQ